MPATVRHTPSSDPSLLDFERLQTLLVDHDAAVGFPVAVSLRMSIWRNILSGFVKGLFKPTDCFMCKSGLSEFACREFLLKVCFAPDSGR